MGRFFASCFGFCSSKNQHNRDQQSTIQFQTNLIPNKPSHALLEAGNMRDGSLNISPTEEANCVEPRDQYVVLSCEEADSVHGKKQDKEKEASKLESSSEDIVVSLSPSITSSCPPSHRYRNCEDSDDEDEVPDSHDEYGMVESISPVADSSTYVCGSNRKNARLRTAYICPVLNPVENLSQWNVVKSKEAMSPTPDQKENLKLEQESTSSKSKAFKSIQEPSVDASLSNWLASSETTPVSKITTTLALEGNATAPVKSSTLQESSSLGRSGRCSKMPEVSDEDSTSSFKGIPNTTSKYREDKTVNWHSTPFETRLERALNRKGVAKA